MFAFVVLSLLVVSTTQLEFTAEQYKELYLCKDEYEFLTTVNRLCGSFQYFQPLTHVKKTLSAANGKLLVKQLDAYCAAVDAIIDCAVGDIIFSRCRPKPLEKYREMMDMSSYICKPGVRERVNAKLENLPSVALSSDDSCYRESVKQSYDCIKAMLDTNPPNKLIMWKRVIKSFPCAYRGLKEVCDPAVALTLTLLNYDSVLFPPALGVNVTSTFLRLPDF